VLVGREGQLALLGLLRAQTREGAGQVLLLEGEAGIGKSAILDTCAAQCDADGIVVLRGHGDELGATRPFAPLLDALAHGPHGEATQRAVRDRIMQERSSPHTLLETEPGLQSLLVDDLVNQIEELCVDRPVALCVDDLHWADGATLTTLASLVRRAVDLPLLVALAMRRVPRRDDLAAFVDMLDDPPPGVHATHTELTPLGTDDVTVLATSVLGAAPGPGLDRLLDACAGNPLLVVELLVSLRDAGLLDRDAGAIDTASDPTDLHLPTTLTETVRRRMAHLDEELKAVASIAALLGTRFTLGDLASVTARPATDLFPLVQTLIEARLVTDDGTALSYRHDLVREAVVSAFPESVRAELHRGIAEALQAAGAPTMRVAEQLALGAAPGSPEAVSVLRSAAEEIAQQDPAGAASLLQRALEVSAPTDSQRDLVYAQLVDALSWSGRVTEAQAMADEVLSRPVSPDAEIRLRSALSRSLLLLARPHDAIPHEERLIELRQAEGQSPASALSECAACRVFGLDLDGALHDAVEGARLGEQDGDAMAVILGLSIQAFAQTALGQSAEAAELATRAAALADATPGGEGHRLHPNLYRGVALQSLGRHAEAASALERGRTLGEALGAAWALPIYHLTTALTHWDSGRWDDLLTEIDAGTVHSAERALSLGQVWAYAVAGRVHVHRGELDQAALMLDAGDSIMQEGGMQFGADWLALSRALLLEAQGRRAEGLDLLRLVWETAAGLRASASLVLVGGDLARLAVESGDEECAGEVAAELTRLADLSPDDLVVRGRERRARGLTDRDADALRASVDAFDQQGNRFETALVRAELAELLLAQGHADVAPALFEAALADLDAVGASPEADRVRARLARLAPSSGRVAAPRRPVSGWEALTPTEHEVVEEVCGGRSNPQVAERLGISRRTVEAHLRSIYSKLGVSTRLALAVSQRERADAAPAPD
jgi:DNA-binding CsgD family transcriptional regulator